MSPNIMAKLPVLEYPTESLKKPSKEVKEFGQNWLRELVENMFETMYAAEGLGLAAPQVGENINLFVMDVSRPDPLDSDNEIPDRIYMINPEIKKAEGVYEYEEGCLSCPDLLINLNRPNNIVVHSFDVEGNPQQHFLSEVASVCTQHEMDHLKGILLTDHISRLQREFYGKKQMRKRRSERDRSKL